MPASIHPLCFLSFRPCAVSLAELEPRVWNGRRNGQETCVARRHTCFVVAQERSGLGSNTILHNAVIVAQFLKRHGRSGITKELSLPERISPLVKIYPHEELARFFAACSDAERALFATLLLSGFREQGVMFLRWSDVYFELRTVRVSPKQEPGLYPKRWEDREIPAPVELIDELRKHKHRPNGQFVFPSPTGNRERHMLDHCKSITNRAKLDPTKFDLKDIPFDLCNGNAAQGFDVEPDHHLLILLTYGLGIGLAVRVENVFPGVLPGVFEFGRGDVPVRPALSYNGTQVLTRIFNSRPAEKPVAIVDLIDDKTGLEKSSPPAGAPLDKSPRG